MQIDLPIVRHFRGFDPQSPNLFGPATAAGTCMGSFMAGGSLIWYDSGIRPVPGDIVLIEVPIQSGSQYYAKEVQRIAGKLWGLSEDAPMPIMKPMRIVGVMVAAMTSPAARQPVDNARDPELYAALLRHAAPMLAHVVRHGFDAQ
jgi:hypothetical protein